MNCSQARIQLSGYVDGELSTSQSSQLEELRRELTRYEAPAALHRCIRTALQAKTTGVRTSWWRRLDWAVLTPAAGMAFAVLFTANVVILSALPSKEERLA